MVTFLLIVATVVALASALGCVAEDLLERRYNPATGRMI